MSKNRELIETISECVSVAFLIFREMRPFYHAVSANGEEFVISLSGIDKNVWAATARQFFKEKSVVRYVFVTEAWTLLSNLDGASKEKIEDLKKQLKEHGLKNHPDAVESVTLTAEDESEGYVLATRRIIRNGNKATLGPLEISDEPYSTFEGRFVGLLPQKGATQ